MPVARMRSESGITMLVTIATLAVMMGLIGALLQATTFDSQSVRNTTAQSKAYYAAQSGISAYLFHLGQDPQYWTTCPTANNVTLPNTPDESYSFTPVPSSSWSGGSCSTSDPIDSMIETASGAAGTFRVLFTGYDKGSSASAHTESRSIIVTFFRRSFLNYVYYTEYETLDPIADPQEPSNGPGQSPTCYAPRAQRSSQCVNIQFVTGDVINGPMHSEDTLDICSSQYNTPVFGRAGYNDPFETTGYACYDGGSATPKINGTWNKNANGLKPPPNDNELSQYAGNTYYGPTDITFNGSQMTIRNANVNGGNATAPMAIPSVIWIANDPKGSCSDPYTPFGTQYDDLNNKTASWYDPAQNGCADAYVSGSYSTSVTVGAARDIVITGNLTTSLSGNSLLGLVANNFIEIYHPIKNRPVNSSPGSCGGWGSSDAAPLVNPTIDAALLAVNDSFIVDNYDCGSSNLGTLTVNGSISQIFRGTVGTNGSGGTGYLKSYNYDTRLAAESPPHFLSPVQAGWKPQRESACNVTATGTPSNPCA